MHVRRQRSVERRVPTALSNSSIPLCDAARLRSDKGRVRNECCMMRRRACPCYGYTMSQIVIAVVDDMFFASKIRAVAEAVGVEISFPRSKEALLEKAREALPQLILVDLHNQKVD